VQWPPSSSPDGKYVVSEKDDKLAFLKDTVLDILPTSYSPKDTILLMGASGYLGSHLKKAFEAAGMKVRVSKARLDERGVLRDEIEFHGPRSVVCAAGISGRPTVEWCETHKAETIKDNVLGQLMVVDVCKEKNIHCVLLGTGQVYQYDEAHTPGSGIGFKESEAPNYYGSFYAKMRVQLESLLQHYDHVLNLRILYPISSDMHEKSLLTKLIKYSTVLSIPTSMTIIDALFPYVVKMVQQDVSGCYNFTCRGAITNNDILELYKKHINPELTWKNPPEEETARMMKVKPHAELNTDKLAALFPDLPTAHQAMEQLVKNIRK